MIVIVSFINERRISSMKNKKMVNWIKKNGSLSGLIGFAFVLLIIGSVSSFAAGTGVKDASLKVFMNFGTCVSGSPSSSSRAKTDYNIFECENAMKWDGTEGSQGNFNYSGGDAVANWCSTNGCLMRGHTMCWGAQTPTWVQSLSRTAMLAAMKNHITNLMTHWKGKVLEWDIVNEAVSDGSASLKGTFWQRQIGNDFIDSAFTYAYQADSNVYLYYNDYSAEAAGSTKSDYIYNMVKSMQQRGIPIHGVGLQCHLTAPVTKDAISANIKRIGDLGLRVSCTEVDIMKGATSSSSWSNLVQACVENYNATTFLCWGLDDAHSWRGSSCACQLWDASGQPRSSIITEVENTFTGGDAAVAAKRAAFLKLTPSDIFHGKGSPIALENARNRKAATPSFTFNNNTLSYYLPADQDVRVQVIDVRGKAAFDMNMGMQTAGTHCVRWTRQAAPAGLYFAKIKSGNQAIKYFAFPRLN